MRLGCVFGVLFLVPFCEGKQLEPRQETKKEVLIKHVGKCPWCGFLNPSAPLGVECLNYSLQNYSLALAKSNNMFAAFLYQVFKDDSTNKNIFYSPGILSAGLGMARLGARGKTSKELDKALYWEPKPCSKFKEAMRRLLLRMKQMSLGTNNMFEIANHIWVQNGFPVRYEFMNLAQFFYLASAQSVDFNDSPQTRDIINGWVNGKTNGKFKEILPEDAISSSTKLVLTNALYFKGTWKIPFDKDLTVKAKFHISETETKMVDMMTVKGEFGYSSCSNLASKMVELPYEGDELSMIIILPDTSIEDADKRINLKDFADCVATLRNEKKNLTINLPKFEVRGRYKMKKVLKKDLGVNDLFVGSRADLTGLVDPPASEGLHVDEIYHQAFIEVDEIGAKAGAATTVVVDSFIFNVNRPFMFSIQDLKTGTILLLVKSSIQLQTSTAHGANVKFTRV